MLQVLLGYSDAVLSYLTVVSALIITSDIGLS